MERMTHHLSIHGALEESMIPLVTLQVNSSSPMDAVGRIDWVFP